MLFTSQKSRGNALFLVLIAVALFAALGFAVTKSRSSSGSIDREKMAMDASRMIQYASYVRAGAQRLVLAGTRPEDLLLTATSPGGPDPCTAGADCLFATEGGGLLAQPAPSSLGPSVSMQYAEAAGGVNMTGIGTSAADIWLAAGPISDIACAEINKILRLGDTINVDSDFTDNDIDAYPGEDTACFLSDGANVFYMVLIPL